MWVSRRLRLISRQLSRSLLSGRTRTRTHFFVSPLPFVRRRIYNTYNTSLIFQPRFYTSGTTAGPAPYLSERVKDIPPSATLAINEFSDNLIAQGQRVYKLGLGQSPFPVPEVVANALRKNAHQKDYLPVKGLLDLRNAVAKHFTNTRTNTNYRGSDVVVGPGSKELLFLVQMCYDCELVIGSPSWVSYAPQAKLVGHKVRWIDCCLEDDWKIKPHALNELCKKDPQQRRILLINYPNNPSGSTYTASELKELASVLKRYDVLVLSDEIYASVTFSGVHASLASFYPEGTIVTEGISKWCGAGGWRLGVSLFPSGLKWLQDAVANVASETFTSVSAPVQYAAVRAYEGGPEIDEYLRLSRRILKATTAYAASRLNAVSGVKCMTPQGGFYCLPDCTHSPAGVVETERNKDNAQWSSTSFFLTLLEKTGVAVLAGSHFGRPQIELTCRLACVDFDGSAALKGWESTSTSMNDMELVEKLCPNVWIGVERIAQYLENPAAFE